ncbi:MAG: Fic family protein [Clostridiales Family XIII bacterium]|jgi:Fic family protein|nr:Fic family protein [Clostridiales Family XIII bacterium]
MSNDKLDILTQLRTEREMGYKGGLYHITQIDFAYNSNHIEGSTLTSDETRYIYETNSLVLDKNEAVNIDDIVETLNHFKCFDYLLDVAENDLSEEIIKAFHRILKEGTSDEKKPYFAVGDYKKIENTVGNVDTTMPDKVPEAMRNLLESYNYTLSEYPDAKDLEKLEKLIGFHVRFERIHPFQDGNGRVGRLIMFKECLRIGISPFIIEDKNRAFYLRGIRRYDVDRTQLYETIRHEQEIFDGRYEKFAFPKDDISQETSTKNRKDRERGGER